MQKVLQKGCYTRNVCCVEIAKTNSVLAATAPPASSAFSKQPPTKSPDVYFAQVHSRESVHCSAIILLMWKLGKLTFSLFLFLSGVCTLFHRQELLKQVHHNQHQINKNPWSPVTVFFNEISFDAFIGKSTLARLCPSESITSQRSVQALWLGPTLADHICLGIPENDYFIFGN